MTAVSPKLSSKLQLIQSTKAICPTKSLEVTIVTRSVDYSSCEAGLDTFEASDILQS